MFCSVTHLLFKHILKWPHFTPSGATVGSPISGATEVLPVDEMNFFDEQPHFQVEPRVAIWISGLPKI